MRKLIYVAHPFKGDPENIKRVEAIILQLTKLYPDYTFYSPLHATGFFYFAKTYEEGMKDCIEMLSRCDELFLCNGWEHSKGCGIEFNWADEHHMPIKFVDEILSNVNSHEEHACDITGV
ncbi:MAG: DUF4406 domain-containing protein [Clostridiaceae bacterium]